MTREGFKEWLRRRYYVTHGYTAIDGRYREVAQCLLCGRTFSITVKKIPAIFPLAEHFETQHVLFRKEVAGLRP